MQEQEGMCCDGTRSFLGTTLKAQQVIFRKTVSIDVQSPDQKEQYFKESKLAVSFSSPPNSGCENQIPDEEVISYYIPEDNHSYTSYKHVRFSQPSDKYNHGYINRTANVPQQKYRRQRSIPMPEKVQEDLIGESAQLSPNLNAQIYTKNSQQTKQTKNITSEQENQFNFNALSLQNSFYCKTISSQEQMNQTNQMADELANIVKNYLNDITYIEKHFTFEEQEDDYKNKLNLQQKILKKALEHLNFKLNVTLCSPISKISATSPRFEDLHINVKDLQTKIEEISDTNDLLKDKIEIQETKLLEQYDQIKQMQKKILELEIENKSLIQQFELEQNSRKNLNEQINQQKQQLDDQIKTLQCQQLKIQQLEQLVERNNKKNNQDTQNLNINQNQFKAVKRHTNSFHEVSSSSNGNKLVIVNSSTNSSQQSPKNSLLQNNEKIENPDNTTYFGSIIKDKKQGYGNLKKGDKKLYMGFWKDDNFNGFGHLNNENIEEGIIDVLNLNTIGNKWVNYQGEFQDGLFHGYGIWTFCDSSRFHGLFQQGKANGRGTYYTNLNTIKGLWKQNIKI